MRSLLAIFLFLLKSTSVLADDLVFSRTCDGSAAVRLGNEEIAVADDEDSTLWFYSMEGGEPKRHNFSGVPARPEPDFEGAARIGDRIYWIGSHSRNSKGKLEPTRRVIVATDLSGQMIGDAYPMLLDKLTETDQSEKLGLADSIGGAEPSRARAAEAGGLNIEGLAAKPDGSALIGLRNPRSDDGEAVLVPIGKLDSVGTTHPTVVPRKPIKLFIDELGIRDIAWSKELDAFLVIGGTSSAGDDFRLYRWAGDDSPARLITRIEGIGPEAVVPLPNGHSALLLSDDGDRRVAVPKKGCESGWKDGSCPCKQLTDDALRSFRGRIVKLD